MTVFKCKMCGGSIDVVNNESVAECEYCGTKQTLPKMDDEKRINLYNRANHFRQQCAFDKAEQIYEKIVAEMPDDAEAHWSLVLCRYGIEYVEDPSTLERVPTCHRASYDSIFDDIDYIEAVNKADTVAVSLYQKEAAKIDRIQKGILEISQKEKPFDIFICYKETDSTGERTLDSVKAQEIYDTLTDKGYKVFFSRITLEDKLGQAYEPYIFAALNSAKVMLVVGTNPDHINAVWVKNEWSRYLKIMSKKKDRTLIPCYLNISPYELPDEFSYLQGQDMSKIGFMQDLIKGIGKLIPKNNHTVQKTTAVSDVDNKIKGLINLISLAIEEKNWDKADNLCEQLMMTQPDSAFYYVFKLIIGYEQEKDVSNIVKKLNKLYPNISDEEKAIINEENSQNYFWMFLKYDCVSRAEYIIKIFPELMTKSYYLEDTGHCSLLNYSIAKFKDEKILKNLLKLDMDFSNSYRIVFKTNADNIHTDEWKIPPLLEAVWANTEVLKILLDNGINTQERSIYTNTAGNSEYNILAYAVWNVKNTDMVRILLEHGADANATDYLLYDDKSIVKRSMLSYAISDAQNIEMVKLLLEYGANVNMPSRIHITKVAENICNYPLSEAIVYSKNVEMVKLLLDKGAAPNTRSNIIYSSNCNEEKSMLTYAVIDTKNIEMIKLLLEYGADPNKAYRIFIKDYENYKFSILNEAITRAQSVEILKLLLEYGADANYVEHYVNGDRIKGTTSMLTYAALYQQNQDMVSLLLKYGATWNNVITYDGITKIEKKFPYQKYVSKEFAKFLKTQGWTGSLF